MSVSTASLTGAFAGLVGADRVLDAAPALARVAVDGCVPRWVVRPAKLDQVGGVLALAHDAELAVLPRGSGSAQALGAPPRRGDVALDLGDLGAVVEYNPDDLTVTVQAGITAGTLAARLAARRQWLPLDPPGAATRTLGGIAATNASGPLRARYGTMRDLLLGVRFVQADGVLTWGGARVVKSVTGYDVPKLMVGALGTLGVLGELTLRLHPMPAATATWLATFPNAAAAHAFVALLLDSHVQPNRVELLNRRAGALCDAPPAPAAVAVAVASVAEAVRAQGELVQAFARRPGGAVTAAREDFWEAYDRATAEPGAVRLRVATLVSELAATVEAIEGAAAGLDTPPLVTGCCAAGTLGVGLDGASAPVAARVVERLRAFVRSAGGSVVIERGPRDLRASVDPWGPVDPGALALMRGLKETFDPRGILNPGRFVGGL